MRSTVSYMLSHGSGEPTMSHPDYEQQAHHHGCLLVLVRGIGPSKPRSLQTIFERLQKVNNVKITDLNGQIRDIWVRYVQDHPVENNDWGDFQTHRRLLGLITVGKYDTQSELNELCRIHESLKVKYVNTLYDSRCILFRGTKKTSKQAIKKTLLNEGAALAEQFNSLSSNDSSSNKENSSLESSSAEVDSSIESTNKNDLEQFTTPSNFKSQAFMYPENDTCVSLESNIVLFLNSLFWILESKRLDKSREKVDKVTLLQAPFEKKLFVGLDLDTRNNRKRCMGRVTKNLGDLTLQAGLVKESLTLFHAAYETLRAISDCLWSGAASEALCAASAIILYPNIRYAQSVQKNASLQEQKSKATDQEGKAVVTDVSFLNKTSNENNSNMVDKSSPTSSTSSCSVASNPSTSTSPMSSSSESDKTEFPPNIIMPFEISTRYRDAIINYSKYGHAGIIETEAALKAARICIEQNQKLDVAMFLQNALYINLNMTELERVQRFETLTDLYQKIGYHRKAAFCQRLAAWRHVAQSNTNPDWAQSYRLMLDSFSGHKLSLDPIEVLQQNAGWPCLQIDLLQQLVAAARRLGHSALATRHMTFLLQTMWKHLSAKEQSDMATQLQNLSAQCEGAPVPLVLESGIVIPPANLTNIPICEHFNVNELPSHLRPFKITASKEEASPFIFTPIHFHSNSIDRKQKKDNSKIAFQWVQNDSCEVTVKLKNPLPFELRVGDMRLLTNGVVFEALPETVVLQTGILTTATLHGTPIENGLLEIEGYSTHALGVKSNCRLKEMSDRNFPPTYKVNVIPALPVLSIATSFPQTATFSGMPNADSVIVSASVTIYNGESNECTITLTNDSNVPIEFLHESIQSNMDAKMQNRVFQWDTVELQSKLPILPHCSIDFKMTIFADADFLGPISNLSGATALASPHPSLQPGGGGGADAGPQSLGMSTLSVSGHNSIPSRMSSPMNTLRRTELTSSFRSTQSGHSSLATISLGAAAAASSSTVRHIESQLRFRYSGGKGLQADYCRQCAVSFNLEFLPSAQITNWDVLPAETPSQFYLVLDVINLTEQEMTLNYTVSKNIIIEAKESCRIPVPVEKCPLERLLLASETTSMENQCSIISSEVDLTERICSEHISDQVDLKWTLAGTETQGVTLLNGISLSPTMLGLITVAPLQWEIFIDDTSISIPQQAEVTCTAGQNIMLGVKIINLSPSPLQQITLTVKFYQDYQNGVQNFKLETRVIMSGPDRILVDILKHNESAFHESSVIFFTPGRFKADITCISQQQQMVKKQNTNPIINSQSDIQIWRLIPPLDITVTE